MAIEYVGNLIWALTMRTSVSCFTSVSLVFFCMYFLFLIICLIRANVEVPSRNFPRPSLLRHKNHPSRSRHGVCMSSIRLVLLLFSYKTKYLIEVVLSFMVFS